MSGALAFDAAWLFAAFLIVIVLLAAGITARRYLLERGGGTVECGLRMPDGSWRLGVAAYQPDELRWYQIFGFLLRPSQVFSRRTLTVLNRRLPTPDEAASLGEGAVVVECRVAEGHGTVELAMSDGALTGFLAWLEAAPPGSPGSYLGQAELGTRAGSARAYQPRGRTAPPGPAQRSPPGFQSTSPSGPFASLARMNSRSESRFR